jgi:rubrerythrin
MVAKLWICEICGDPYIGEEAPKNCPFCGAHKRFIKSFRTAKVNWDVKLNDVDRANVRHALKVEVSNAIFYFCAAKKTRSKEGQKLFKILGKVENEHASVWKKILGKKTIPDGKETCSKNNIANLKDSHAREVRAIAFYKQAYKEAKNKRVKTIFKAFIEVEKDHLALSAARLK